MADREIIDPAVLKRAGISREEEERGALQKVARAEREIIEQIIKKHPRDLDAAARELAVSRTTLWRRMKKYDMIARSRGSGADR